MVRKITMARKPRIHYPGTVYHVIRYIHLNPVRAKDPIDYSLSSHAAYIGNDECQSFKTCGGGTSNDRTDRYG
jgi:hypothetical protein